MNESELTNYAENLRHLAENEVHIDHLREDLEERQVWLTPSTGFEGKNEELRKALRDKVFSDDDVLVKIKASIRDAENYNAFLKGAIASFEAYRRDWEWQIRLRMVEALKGTTPTSDSKAVENAAFDDLAQAQSELEVIAVVEKMGQPDPVEQVGEAEKFDELVEAVNPEPDIQVYAGEDFMNGLLSLADSAGDDIPF